VELPKGASHYFLEPSRRRHIFLLLKEALNNAAKHSDARHVALEIMVRGKNILFVLVDDGCGFDPAVKPVSDRLSGGRGLLSMTERAKALGGTVHLESALGKGTTVRVEIPGRGNA
jgi:signal transduction histidine kinase